MTCSDCVFVEVQILDDDGMTYACHRFPPQVGNYDGEPVMMWPQVSGGDWCGEFKQAPK